MTRFEVMRRRNCGTRGACAVSSSNRACLRSTRRPPSHFLSSVRPASEELRRLATHEQGTPTSACKARLVGDRYNGDRAASSKGDARTDAGAKGRGESITAASAEALRPQPPALERDGFTGESLWDSLRQARVSSFQ